MALEILFSFSIHILYTHFAVVTIVLSLNTLECHVWIKEILDPCTTLFVALMLSCAHDTKHFLKKCFFIKWYFRILCTMHCPVLCIAYTSSLVERRVETHW